jgi:dihydroflavonol-4-reductase
MKNVLVTGGTGFIGSNLALALLNQGLNVRILRRPDSDLRAIGSAEVDHRYGDVREIDSLKRAMSGCDTVFHTAAVVSYWRRDRERMYDVNVGGTRNMVQACIETGIQKLVHTSSVAAIGFPENGPWADETNVFNWEPYDVGYRISKHRAELEIQRGVSLGLSAVIVNPSIVIGPRDIHFNGGQIVRDIYKKRLFFYIEGGMNVVHVNDVVRGQIAAARMGRIGERYILCGENLPIREVFKTTAEVVGGIVPKIRMPKSLVHSAAFVAEMIGNVTNSKPWLTRELVARAGTSYYFSCAKAEHELAYTITPFLKAIEETFTWYMQNGLLS